MSLVLWIDKNTFATNLLEKVFKQKDLGFYALPSVSDFAYLVEDLKPTLIVLDHETVLDGLSDFKRQYEASETMQKTAFTAIGSWDQVEFIAVKRDIIERMFDPFTIPEKILHQKN